MASDLTPAATPLQGVADKLLEAHQHAVMDGDQQLLELIESALLHLGHRLASESMKAIDPTN